jgi:hypothetical protein
VRDYLEDLAREMGAESVLSGDATATFVLRDRGGASVRMRLRARGRDVVLDQLTGPDEGRTAVIADCAHLVG